MKDLFENLKGGEIGVIPTDTLYGVVGSALNREVVRRIYELKGRDSHKPFIILINSADDLKFFGLSLSDFQKEILSKFWPGKISVVLDCPDEDFYYLHRGQKTLAFRVPDKRELLELIKLSGPLVAPSANPQGESPAKNIPKAKKYFGDRVDFYIDGGELESLPSTLIRFNREKVEVLREGAVKIKNFRGKI